MDEGFGDGVDFFPLVNSVVAALVRYVEDTAVITLITGDGNIWDKVSLGILRKAEESCPADTECPLHCAINCMILILKLYNNERSRYTLT